jgi:hypothetical protein
MVSDTFTSFMIFEQNLDGYNVLAFGDGKIENVASMRSGNSYLKNEPQGNRPAQGDSRTYFPEFREEKRS